MMRRHALPAVVLLALALALTGAATARVPGRLPAVGLGSTLVWRVEIAAFLFGFLYGVVIVLRLALHGETLTRVGRDGIEIPRVGSPRGGGPASPDDVIALADRLKRLAARVDRAVADDPTHERLRREPEDT